MRTPSISRHQIAKKPRTKGMGEKPFSFISVIRFWRPQRQQCMMQERCEATQPLLKDTWLKENLVWTTGVLKNPPNTPNLTKPYPTTLNMTTSSLKLSHLTDSNVIGVLEAQKPPVSALPKSTRSQGEGQHSYLPYISVDVGQCVSSNLLVTQPRSLLLDRIWRGGPSTSGWKHGRLEVDFWECLEAEIEVKSFTYYTCWRGREEKEWASPLSQIEA